MSSHIGHADLLRVAAALVQEGRDLAAGLAEAARVLGYEQVPSEPPKPASLTAPPESAQTVQDADDGETPAAAPALADAPYWQPWTLTWHSEEQRYEQAAREREDAEADAAADAVERRAIAEVAPPPAPPLSPRSRLAPMLQRALTTDRVGRDLDIPALVRGWSRGRHFTRLPHLPRRGCPALVLILDRGYHLVPFWRDELAVYDLLLSLVGDAGLVVRFLDDRGPDGAAFDENEKSVDLLDGSLAGLPVLALTDLGWYGGARLRKAWLRLGQQLRRAGERLAALVPVPVTRWTPELTRVWAPMPWERPGACDPASPAQREEQANKLLDLAAHTRRLEPGLLRALRLLLPRSEADVGTEADAWMHEDIASRCADATALRPDCSERPDRVAARRERFAKQPLALRARVAALLHTWHWHHERRPEVWHAEALSLAARNSGVVSDAAAKSAAQFMARLGRRTSHMSRRPGLEDQKLALRRWLDATASHVKNIWSSSTVAGRGLQLAWWATHDADDPPPDADPSLYAVARNIPRGAPTVYALRHVGDALEVWPHDLVARRNIPPGAPVAPLWAAAPVLCPVGPGVDVRSMSLAEPARLAATSDALELRTDTSTLVLRTLDRPAWATAIGRDHHGLWVTVDVRGASFRLRWIPPGFFRMGSPDSEEGRFLDEGPQHDVVISRGFWLGETPVTQALWKAVMDNNPSRFQDAERPVEQVSWEDAQEFLEQLNEAIDEDHGECFRLPSEAEWEYACRAGTTTATHAGDLEIRGDRNAPLLDKIAWYGGNSGVDYDLAEGEDSSDWPSKQYPHTRAGTRRVMQKQPNPWGLHDMLGNVFEWCSDARGPYTANSSVLTDPVALGSKGVRRVYRGGSWFSFAQVLRAAYRLGYPPSRRDDLLGFRLARGQEQKGPDADERNPPAGLR